jgi:hypothetical protein
MTGSGDSGRTRVTARVWFWGEIGMGIRGGGAPKLIWGCRRSPEALGFEVEIKSEFN